MKSFLDFRFSKAQVMAMAGNLRHDECGIEAMFAQMKQADTPRVAYHAAWVLSHLSKEDKRMYLLPRYEELVDMAISATLGFRRGLVLSILTDLPVNEPSGRLLDYCLVHLADSEESNSARAAMIKLAAKMCKPYPELCKELLLCLDMMPHDSSPSVAAAKRNALKLIRKQVKNIL